MSAFFRSMVLTCAAFFLMTPAHAIEYVDYTDHWVAAHPSAGAGDGGFGISIVQSGNGFNYMFTTFYIYDPETGKPDWVTGDMERETGKASFAGRIYRTSGDPTSNPFTPRNTETRTIGTLNFNPTSPTTGTLVYTVNGSAAITLELKRLSLTENILDGTYMGVATINRSRCNNGDNNGLFHQQFKLDVEKKTGSTHVTYNFKMTNYDCEMEGVLNQEGRFQNVKDANFACYQGNDRLSRGTAQLSNLSATTQGIEGQWTAEKGIDNCNEEGRFAGILQQ